MGIDKSFAYRSRQVQLQPGDCVLFYSDGVTDQLDNQNNHVQQKAIRAAFQEGICAPQALGKRIVKILKRHASGQGQSDDITLVCFGRMEA